MFVMYYFVSFLVLQLSRRGRKRWCFDIIVLQMYCYYKCFVALPHGVVGWSAVCFWYFLIILTYFLINVNISSTRFRNILSKILYQNNFGCCFDMECITINSSIHLKVYISN